MTTPALLDACAQRARAFLFDHAFPLWWQAGFDPGCGLFHDKLRLDGSPDLLPRRVRVQARQTFVYALAGDLGWSGPWRAACEAGAAGLMRARHPEGGFVHRYSADGSSVADARRDLYDTAFAVFALAHAGRALDREDLIDAAADTLVWLEGWADAEGGFAEGEIDPVPPRRQNPHMHLFEAALAIHAANGEPRVLAFADRIAELFGARFFDRAHGALPEYFDAQWTPLADERGQVTEPGHHFEWAWLITRWNDAGGQGLMNEAERLVAHAETFGIDPNTGCTRAEVSLEGRVLNPRARFWANTERLKAQIVRYARTRDPASAAAAVQAWHAIEAFCDVPVRGLWRDWRNPDGSFDEESAPASSFYHLALACAELIRINAMLLREVRQASPA
jgi:mannose-6-phosphate isomerase